MANVREKLYAALSSGNLGDTKDILAAVDISSPETFQSLLHESKFGEGLLHCVNGHNCIEVTELVLDNLTEKQGKNLICQRDYAGFTVLMMAVDAEDHTLIRFLLSNPRFQPFIDDLTEPDNDGNGLLHFASDREVLDTVLDNLIPEQQAKIIRQLNTDGANFLYSAVSAAERERHYPMIEYILTDSRFIPYMDLLLLPNKDKNGLFHVCHTPELIELMMRHVTSEQLNLLIRHRNSIGQSVLLTAAKESRDSIIVYFLTNTNSHPHVDYLLQTDEDGNGLLHCISSDITAESMFDHLTTKQQKELICQRNNSGDTILHSALKNWKDRHWGIWQSKVECKNYDIFLYFLWDDKFQPFLELLLQPDADGNTPLHLCVIDYIEFSVSIPDPTIGCNVKSLSEFLVEHLEKEEDLLRTVLRHKNKHGRTVFHLAALCPSQEFHDYLWEYADQLEIPS